MIILNITVQRMLCNDFTVNISIRCFQGDYKKLNDAKVLKSCITFGKANFNFNSTYPNLLAICQQEIL